MYTFGSREIAEKYFLLYQDITNITNPYKFQNQKSNLSVIQNIFTTSLNFLRKFLRMIIEKKTLTDKVSHRFEAHCPERGSVVWFSWTSSNIYIPFSVTYGRTKNIVSLSDSITKEKITLLSWRLSFFVGGILRGFKVRVSNPMYF